MALRQILSIPPPNFHPFTQPSPPSLLQPLHPSYNHYPHPTPTTHHPNTSIPFRLAHSLIVIIGLVGNSLVIGVVLMRKHMRNTTNILIINLAVADLLFIVFCVPFTAISYSLPSWPFGTVVCKLYQYSLNVSAYASVYTLVLMSMDRLVHTRMRAHTRTHIYDHR